MRPLSPALLVVSGLCLFLSGFAYDVIFAGIPYQDPTPELSAGYSLHSRIASWIRWAGLGVIAAGGVAAIAGRIARRRKRTVER